MGEKNKQFVVGCGGVWGLKQCWHFLFSFISLSWNAFPFFFFHLAGFLSDQYRDPFLRAFFTGNGGEGRWSIPQPVILRSRHFLALPFSNSHLIGQTGRSKIVATPFEKLGARMPILPSSTAPVDCSCFCPMQL